MKLRAPAPSLALLLLAACSTGGETDDRPAKTGEAASSAPAPAAEAAPAKTAAAVVPAVATTFSIEPRIKAEVDNRPEGLAEGTALRAGSAPVTLVAPASWVVSKGETTVARSGDERARVAVASFGPEGPEQRVVPVASAAGLTNCQWSTPEPAIVGKDKLSATVADGICSRGAGQVRAARMATEGLLAIGSWDEGGDAASVFNALRSVKRAAVGSDGIAACCNALRQNAKASPAQAGIYLMAAGACDAARKNPDSARALQSVRSMLAGAGTPASCK